MAVVDSVWSGRIGCCGSGWCSVVWEDWILWQWLVLCGVGGLDAVAVVSELSTSIR